MGRKITNENQSFDEKYLHFNLWMDWKPNEFSGTAKRNVMLNSKIKLKFVRVGGNSVK